jgi:hypothetical protein
MTDSSGNYAGFEDIPSSALTASLLATDHDVAARIARGHEMLRRDIRDRAGVARLVIELTEWSAANRDLLATRFANRTVADTYVGVAEPFVVPAEASDIDSQVDLLRRQLRHQVEWLERLRLTIPERQQPASVDLEPRLARSHVARRSVAVLATTASSTAAAVVGAVARATGILPVVIEDHPGERRSLVRAAEDAALPSNAIAVVVLEPPARGPRHASASSLLALGYAAGALGTDDVIAVLAPGVTHGRDLRDFTTVVMEDDDGWRHELESLLADAAASTAAVVSSIRRS